MEIGREVVQLGPESVDISGDWLFWAREPSARLITSLYRLGQVEPVLAVREGAAWVLVTGYARTLALRGMNAPVNALEFKGSDTDMGMAYMASNSGKTLTPGMKLKAVRFFSNRMKADERRETVWPHLRIDEDSEEWEALKKWLLLPPSYDEYLFRDLLPLSAGRPLAKFKDNELAALMPVIEVLEMPTEDAVSLVTRLYSAGRAGQDDAAKLIDKHGFYDILEEDLPAEEKRRRIMDELKGMPG